MDPVDLCQVSSILIPCAKAGRLQMNLQILRTLPYAHFARPRGGPESPKKRTDSTSDVRAINLLVSSTAARMDTMDTRTMCC